MYTRNQVYTSFQPTIHKSMHIENDKNNVQKEQTNNWTFDCKECDKIITGVESQDEHLKSKNYMAKVSAKKTPVLLPMTGTNQLKLDQETCFT